MKRLILRAAFCSLPAYLPITASASSTRSAGGRARRSAQDEPVQFVGSSTCAACHSDIYERWRHTLMANILVDPSEHPEAVLGDFSTPNPLVTFGLDDVAFIYGSKWKQRYFSRIGDTFFVQPAQWDVQHKVWRRYYVENGADWWVEHYPADVSERPTGPLCDGCHSTGYDVETRQVVEWNVGCEKCHGPGGEHVRAQTPHTIVNPARLDPNRGVDVCIECRSQGQPQMKPNPSDGVYYDWPVGYLPGDRLSEEYRLRDSLARARARRSKASCSPGADGRREKRYRARSRACSC